MEKYPWAKAVKEMIDRGSSNPGLRKSSDGSGSDSASAASGSGSSGIETHEDRRRSAGVLAAVYSPSAPNLIQGQPFFELLSLVKDARTHYSHGLAMMVAKFGNLEIMQAFKARGWLKEAAAENSWLSGALLGRRSERGSGGRS